MKISKRQLKRIIKEEARQLLEQPSRSPGDTIQAVKDAILELFVLQGEVRTADVFDHLGMNGYTDPDIDSALMQLTDEY